MTKPRARRRPSKATLDRLIRQIRRDLAQGPKLWETMIAGLTYRQWRPLGGALTVMVAAGEVAGVGTEEGCLYYLGRVMSPMPAIPVSAWPAEGSETP